MSQVGFRGALPPAGEGPKVYTILGADRKTTLDLTFLEERILGVSCHWVVDRTTHKGRSRLCGLFEGECEWCRDHPKTWLGFIAVFNHNDRARQVLRVGPDGARVLVRYSSRPDGMRGVRLNVRASTTGRAGSLDVTESDRGPLLPCPPAPCIHATVCLVLGAKWIPEYRRSADELIGPIDSDEQGGVS